MSWKPRFLVNGTWATNAQAFSTREEAEMSASARFMRWTMPSAYDVIESDEPVNYAWINDRDTMVPPADNDRVPDGPPEAA